MSMNYKITKLEECLTLFYPCGALVSRSIGNKLKFNPKNVFIFNRIIVRRRNPYKAVNANTEYN